jgi:hypothetical protein
MTSVFYQLHSVPNPKALEDTAALKRAEVCEIAA